MRDFCLTAVVLGPKSANALFVDLKGEVVSLLNRERRRTSLHIPSSIQRCLLIKTSKLSRSLTSQCLTPPSQIPALAYRDYGRIDYIGSTVQFSGTEIRL
jgi:hypothetical protein